MARDNPRTTTRAWTPHRQGRTEEAVELLDRSLADTTAHETINLIAHTRGQILIDAGRCREAESGIRKVLGLPPGSSEPEIPSAELMDCLFTAMAIGGGDMDLAVIRWLIADAKDRGDAVGAINFAGILISYLKVTDPVEALVMARLWKTEAEAAGEESHANGLQGIIEALTEQ